MPSQTLTLLLTRPPMASRRFLSQLPVPVRDRLDPVISPLLDIKPIAADIEFGDAGGVIFSSANGVAIASGLTGRRDIAAFCVGAATAQAARAAGWNAQALGRTAEELVAKLRLADVPGPLLHLSGHHTRGDVATRLNQAGKPARACAIYDQVLRPLTDQALCRLRSGAPVLAPVFSPRTAAHLADQCPASAQLHVIALSPAVAEPLRKFAYRDLICAETPDSGAMVKAVESVVNRLCRVESRRGAK